MTTKQFLLTTFVSLSLATGIHAAEDTTNAQADEIISLENNTEKLSPEQEIAFGIRNKSIKAQDTVTYEGKEYTVSDFNVTTNEATPNYYNIRYTLAKNVSWLGMNIGKDTVLITVQDGQNPEPQHDKIKNSNARQNTKYVVDVDKYFRGNDTFYTLKRLPEQAILMTVLGSFAYLTLKVASKVR